MCRSPESEEFRCTAPMMMMMVIVDIDQSFALAMIKLVTNDGNDPQHTSVSLLKTLRKTMKSILVKLNGYAFKL